MKRAVLSIFSGLLAVVCGVDTAPADPVISPQERSTAEWLRDFSGQIAVLPAPGWDRWSISPVGRELEARGLTEHLVQITSTQLVDTNEFNATRFPVALFLGAESYYQTVQQAGDGDRALTSYLAGGGAVLVLPCGPYPLYYNQAGQPTGGAGQIGLNIGAGSFENPPPNLNITFVANTNQTVFSGIPLRTPFPGVYEADQRWRPARPPGDAKIRYLPILTLLDDRGGNHGEGVALLERDLGNGRAARVVYAWFSLLQNPAMREPVLRNALALALAKVPPPPPRYPCWRAVQRPVIDGDVADSAWVATPVLNAQCTRAKLPGDLRARWDSQHLYVAWTLPSAEEKVQLSPAIEIARNGELRVNGMTNGSAQIRSAVRAGEKRWIAEMAIPWQVLGESGPIPDSQRDIQFAPAADSPAVAFRFTADPFSDDFELRSAASQGSADWRIEQGQWRLDDGALVGENCAADGYEIRGATRGGLTWSNYTFRARFRVEARGSDWRDGPWFGVRCRPDGDGYYLTFTDRDCQWHKVIYGVSTSEANTLARAPWKPDDRWHTLRVEARGNRLRVSLDDQLLFEGKDNAHLNLPSLRSGGILLAARKGSQSQGTTRVRFDDIIVESHE